MKHFLFSIMVAALALSVSAADKTIADQWQAQVYTRIFLKHKIIYISELPDEMIRDFHMIPAHSIEKAMSIAEELLGFKGTVTAIPDGISVIVKQ